MLRQLATYFPFHTRQNEAMQRVRNATAEKMLAVKETGGVVGVMAYGPYLRGPYQKLRMTPPEFDIPHATIDDLVAHIDHIVKLIGVDHVGLSTDGYLDGTMAHGRKGDGILDGPRRWKEAMRRLHGDSSLRETLQDRGRRRALDPAFSWERVARQTLAVYRGDRAAFDAEVDPLAREVSPNRAEEEWTR